MKKSFLKKYKIILALLFIALILIGGGFFWQKNKNQSKNEISVNTPSPSSSPEPQYPKVSSYEVPILMYHYIRNAENESQLGKNLSVSPKNFDSQIKWLKDNDYQTLKVADLTDPNKKELSKIAYNKKKPIVITFDDGYEDAYTNAYPVLQKYQMTATFYIIRDYVGRPEYMNQSQIDKLEKDGFEIGSHTLSHPDLTKLTPAEAQKQITDSKENALTFCYPAGKYDATTVKLVQGAGYLAAVTTHSGIADQNSNILELPRVRIEESSGEAFGQKIKSLILK
ncbi:MAG: polysaccharide deacetylase family protein [Patescibacteria group bacterium]|nr:polysaccharide deacetylase family protein [Patescibacteria group bacterium]